MAKTAKHTQAYKDATIQNIARDLLNLEALETRRRDCLDFHELAVWQIKAALDAAFEAGRQTSR